MPKDIFLLAHSAAGRNASLGLALAARHLNASLLDHVEKAIRRHLGAAGVSRPVIAVLGLAFKGEPATSDQRGSFGIALAERLREKLPDATIRAWDPISVNETASLDQTLSGADIAVIANDHEAFRQLDLRATAALLRSGGMIYDACGACGAARDSLPNRVTLRCFGNASVG